MRIHAHPGRRNQVGATPLTPSSASATPPSSTVGGKVKPPSTADVLGDKGALYVAGLKALAAIPYQGATINVVFVTASNGQAIVNVTYTGTRAAAGTAFTAFLRAHRGQVGLITVSIGGNDVTSCASAANPISCVTATVTSINTNVTSLVSQLRSAAGTSVPIIGSTYPDVILGAYVYPTHPASQTAQNLAKLSVTAFKALINPALKRAYASGFGAFVDVTAATGAYGSLTTTVHTKTYGTISVPVAKVCTYTWFCQQGNIHAHSVGYALIGKLIVAKYRTIAHR